MLHSLTVIPEIIISIIIHSIEGFRIQATKEGESAVFAKMRTPPPLEESLSVRKIVKPGQQYIESRSEELSHVSCIATTE